MSSDYRDYDPIHPQRPRLARDLPPPLWATHQGAIALAKFSFVLVKFAGIFISVGALHPLLRLEVRVGFVLLILLHKSGHYIEAKREGLNPKLPVFIPFLGAYVPVLAGEPLADGASRARRADPRRGRRAGLFLIGRSQGSDLFRALGYTGFFLNLINLIPVRILDGGAIWRSATACGSAAAAARLRSCTCSTRRRRSRSPSGCSRRTCRGTASL